MNMPTFINHVSDLKQDQENLILTELNGKLYMVIISKCIKMGDFTLAFELDTNGKTDELIYKVVNRKLYDNDIYLGKLRAIPKLEIVPIVEIIDVVNGVKKCIDTLFTLFSQFPKIHIPIEYRNSNNGHSFVPEILNFIELNNDSIMGPAMMVDWYHIETNIDNIIKHIHIILKAPTIHIGMEIFPDKMIINKSI